MIRPFGLPKRINLCFPLKKGIRVLNVRREYVQLGMILRNGGAVDIEFELDQLEARLRKRGNRRFVLGHTGSIPAIGDTSRPDCSLEVSDDLTARVLAAFFSAKELGDRDLVEEATQVVKMYAQKIGFDHCEYAHLMVALDLPLDTRLAG